MGKITKYFDLIKVQIKLSLLSRFRYRVGITSDFIVIGANYFLVYFLQNPEAISKDYFTTIEIGRILILIGFIFWQFSVLALGFTKVTISNDSTTGNIEKKMQSRYSLSFLYFIEMLTYLISNIVIIFFIIIFASFMNNGYYINLLKFLVILGLTVPSLVGMYGMGLIIGGVVIKEKNVGNLVIIIQILLLFLSNTLGVRSSIINYIVPFSAGIDIARDFYMGIRIANNQVIIYIVLNILWLIVGNYVFKSSINKEKMYGSFERY